MPKLDPYSMTDRLDETAISAIVTRLEARGELPFFRMMLDEYLDALEPSRLNRVLEVGCGTGVAARALARHPAFLGHIDASDLSADLIAAAQRLAEDDGCADRITFSVGDARTLSNSEAYDAVIAHTVISHVPDYQALLSSLFRAVAPAGKVVLFDGDFSSITLGAENPTDGEALSNALIEGLVTNPMIMRQVPWLASANGFEIARSFAYLMSEIGTAGFFADGFPSYPVLLAKSGVTDQATAQAWVDQQRAYSEAGTFFGAINFYTYILQPKSDNGTRA
jgi:ubiquinone/menaquinone biosynthesis C-methylase UbiE